MEPRTICLRRRPQGSLHEKHRSNIATCKWWCPTFSFGGKATCVKWAKCIFEIILRSPVSIWGKIDGFRRRMGHETRRPCEKIDGFPQGNQAKLVACLPARTRSHQRDLTRWLWWSKPFWDYVPFGVFFLVNSPPILEPILVGIESDVYRGYGTLTQGQMISRHKSSGFVYDLNHDEGLFLEPRFRRISQREGILGPPVERLE